MQTFRQEKNIFIQGKDGGSDMRAVQGVCTAVCDDMHQMTQTAAGYGGP